MATEEIDKLAKHAGGSIAEMERLALYASVISNSVAKKLLSLGLEKDLGEVPAAPHRGPRSEKDLPGA